MAIMAGRKHFQRPLERRAPQAATTEAPHRRIKHLTDAVSGGWRLAEGRAPTGTPTRAARPGRAFCHLARGGAAVVLAAGLSATAVGPAFGADRPQPMPPGADGLLVGSPTRPDSTETSCPPNTSGTSQNGWPANSDPSAIGVRSYPVEGGTVSLSVKSGDVATVLMYVANRFQAEIENLLAGQVGGYNCRTIAGSSTLSNHSSGTAIDLNWARHPSGSRGTFTSAQVATIRDILARTRGVVRWGGDYSTTVDEMHFEINVSPSDPALPDLARELGGLDPYYDENGPAAASWSNGRLDMFFRTANGTIDQLLSTNGGTSFVHGLNIGGTATSKPAVASRAAGRLDVFVRGTDSALYVRSWNGTTWGGGWTKLDGVLASAPTAVSRDANHVDVFTRGTNGQLYTLSWSPSGWGRWATLGGALTSAPAVASRGSSSLDVYVRGTDDALHVRSWNGAGWGAWTKVGGKLTAPPGAVASDVGREHVLVRGTNGSLYANTYTTSWSGFRNVGGALTSGPAAVSQASNEMDVFVKGDDGHYFINHNTGGAFGSWGGFRRVA